MARREEFRHPPQRRSPLGARRALTLPEGCEGGRVAWLDDRWLRPDDFANKRDPRVEASDGRLVGLERFAPQLGVPLRVNYSKRPPVTIAAVKGHLTRNPGQRLRVCRPTTGANAIGVIYATSPFHWS